jgi:AcrR family transcriptional regulator
MTAEPTRTPVTRAESTAATREAIVHGAHRLFFERHYEDVTFAEIVTAAGVSHQTVLNHFESKEGVVPAMLEVGATFHPWTRAVKSRSRTRTRPIPMGS